MLGNFFGGVAEGQRFREQQDLRKEEFDLRKQEAEQTRQIRDFQIGDLRDERAVKERLKAVPTEVDAPMLLANEQFFQRAGKNADGSALNDEQAAAFAAYAKTNPEWAAQAAQGLRAQAMPGAPQVQYRAQVGQDGQLRIGEAAKQQRSAAQIDLERARILMSSSNPENWIRAQQFLTNSRNMEKEQLEAQMAKINALPISDAEKAQRFAEFMTTFEGVPGGFRAVPTQDGKGAVIQYLDPQTGEMKGAMKPRSFRQIMDDTLSGFSVENYARINGINLANRADARAESAEGRATRLFDSQLRTSNAQATGAEAQARVAVGTEKSQIDAAKAKVRQIESEIGLNDARAGAAGQQGGYYKALAAKSGESKFDTLKQTAEAYGQALVEAGQEKDPAVATKKGWQLVLKDPNAKEAGIKVDANNNVIIDGKLYVPDPKRPGSYLPAQGLPNSAESTMMRLLREGGQPGAAGPQSAVPTGPARPSTPMARPAPEGSGRTTYGPLSSWSSITQGALAGDQGALDFINDRTQDPYRLMAIPDAALAVSAESGNPAALAELRRRTQQQ